MASATQDQTVSMLAAANVRRATELQRRAQQLAQDEAQLMNQAIKLHLMARNVAETAMMRPLHPVMALQISAAGTVTGTRTLLIPAVVGPVPNFNQVSGSAASTSAPIAITAILGHAAAQIRQPGGLPAAAPAAAVAAAPSIPHSMYGSGADIPALQAGETQPESTVQRHGVTGVYAAQLQAPAKHGAGLVPPAAIQLQMRPSIDDGLCQVLAAAAPQPSPLESSGTGVRADVAVGAQSFGEVPPTSQAALLASLQPQTGPAVIAGTGQWAAADVRAC